MLDNFDYFQLIDEKIEILKKASQRKEGDSGLQNVKRSVENALEVFEKQQNKLEKDVIEA